MPWRRPATAAAAQGALVLPVGCSDLLAYLPLRAVSRLLRLLIGGARSQSLSHHAVSLDGGGVRDTRCLEVGRHRLLRCGAPHGVQQPIAEARIVSQRLARSRGIRLPQPGSHSSAARCSLALQPLQLAGNREVVRSRLGRTLALVPGHRPVGRLWSVPARDGKRHRARAKLHVDKIEERRRWAGKFL